MNIYIDEFTSEVYLGCLSNESEILMILDVMAK